MLYLVMASGDCHGMEGTLQMKKVTHLSCTEFCASQSQCIRYKICRLPNLLLPCYYVYHRAGRNDVLKFYSILLIPYVPAIKKSVQLQTQLKAVSGLFKIWSACLRYSSKQLLQPLILPQGWGKGSPAFHINSVFIKGLIILWKYLYVSF